MSFVIKGPHTASTSEPPLCQSCEHSHIMKGVRSAEAATFCLIFYGGAHRIDWHITECSNYHDSRKPRLSELEKIAWRFSADRASRKVGFMTPAEFKAAYPDED